MRLVPFRKPLQATEISSLYLVGCLDGLTLGLDPILRRVLPVRTPSLYPLFWRLFFRVSTGILRYQNQFLLSPGIGSHSISGRHP